MQQPNLEEREQAMDLLFRSLDSTHLHVRMTAALEHEPEREPDTPTTERS